MNQSQQYMTTLLSTIVMISFVSDAAQCQNCTLPETGYFQASPPKLNAQFGSSLKVNAGRALVAAYGEGAAYVLDGSGKSFQQTARLTASNGPVAGFAKDVDIEGNRLVVGTEAGRAYVWEYTASSWQETKILTTSDFNPFAGRIVSLAGDRIAVTHSTYPYSNVYIFTKFGSLWLETNKLTGVQVGSMDMDGDVLAAGGNGLFVYEKSDASWINTFSYGLAGLGVDVKVSGNRIVITSNYPQTAKAYVFEKTQGTWGLKWVIPTTVSDYVDFDGDAIVTSGQGLTEYFDYVGDKWVAGFKTNKSGSVALSDGVILIGDPLSDISAFDAGRVAFGTTGIPILAYGSGCPGVGGFVPELSFTGCPVSGSTLTMSITKGLAGSSALVFVGLSETSMPLKNTGCSLLVGNLLPLSFPVPLLGPGPGLGEIHVALGIPAISTSGSITTQAFVMDPSTFLGVVSTNGVRLTFP